MVFSQLKIGLWKLLKHKCVKKVCSRIHQLHFCIDFVLGMGHMLQIHLAEYHIIPNVFFVVLFQLTLNLALKKESYQVEALEENFEKTLKNQIVPSV